MRCLSARSVSGSSASHSKQPGHSGKGVRGRCRAAGAGARDALIHDLCPAADGFRPFQQARVSVIGPRDCAIVVDPLSVRWDGRRLPAGWLGRRLLTVSLVLGGLGCVTGLTQVRIDLARAISFA